MSNHAEFEVEMKFRIGDRGGCAAAWERLQSEVAACGGQFGESVRQQDTYFAHPQRNFKETDEALRIRRVGDAAKVTYKGPKIDATTKTRRELEFEIHSEAEHTELFEVLGFSKVSTVCKLRRTALLRFQDWEIEVCWDDVEGLGVFLEVETTAIKQDVEQAKAALLTLAERLSLDQQQERRGYLDMLLEPTE